jgi:uncharacterized protein
MFHLFITLAFIVPNIYVFFRIMYLFINKGYKLWYTLVYMLLVAIYPLTENFQHQQSYGFLQSLSSFSGYLLTFYLYLFLALLLVEIYLLVNRLFQFFSREKLKSFTFKFYALSSMVLFSLIVVAGGAINLNTIRVSKYEVEVPRQNSKIDHLQVAFVADLHINQGYSLSFIEQFVRKINELQPDVLLYGGDIVEGDSQNESTDAIESALKSIHTKYGEYGVLGNHEFYSRQDRGSFFEKAGINMLCDSVIKFDSAFYLAGRYDQQKRNRKSLSKVLQNIPHDLPILMIDHRPTQLQKVSQTTVDVQFSGHTHDGQLFPINLIINSMYELGWGYKKIRNTHFFVTSGLRLWGPQVRTVGKSEIMLIDIRFN